MRKLFVIGSGGHAKVVGSAAHELGWIPVYVIKSPESKSHSLGQNFVMESEFLNRSNLDIGDGIICGIGSVGSMRQRSNIIDLYNKFARSFVSIIHPTSIIAHSAKICSGAFIGMGAIVANEAIISENSIVNSGAIVDHNCNVGRNVHIATGATLSGNINIDDHVLIGCGASIIQGVRIGSGTVVGAGTVVVKDIPIDSGVWVGSPARKVLKEND